MGSMNEEGYGLSDQERLLGGEAIGRRVRLWGAWMGKDTWAEEPCAQRCGGLCRGTTENNLEASGGGGGLE